MKTFISLIIFTCINAPIFGQNIHLNGTIEYEKKVNKFALIEKDLKNYTTDLLDEFLRFKTTNPQFLIQKSLLSFALDKTIFTPLPDSDPSGNIWNGKPVSEQLNIVFNDFTNQETITQKTLFGENYLIKDKIRTIKWKITDEIREISGYKCRRANGLIMDSVYVVAFYTGDIPIQSGPESFNGLPGMILGVALPHENTSWFATKVDLIPQKSIDPPSKGQSLNYKTFLDLLKTTYKSYNNSGDKIKAIML